MIYLRVDIQQARSIIFERREQLVVSLRACQSLTVLSKSKMKNPLSMFLV